MSRSEAFVEVFNTTSQQYGRGWGVFTTDDGCSDGTVLQALNIAAYYAGLEAGCSQGQCEINYAAWRCDEQAMAAPTRAESEAAALDNPWFQSLPNKQGTQD